MNRLIIGAPFGNRMRHSQATPTVGTFTADKRAGSLLKWWRVASTLRPCLGGWRNKLGLPNPGIDSLRGDLRGIIISVYGFSWDDWCKVTNWLCAIPSDFQPLAIEANLSCPNINRKTVKELVEGCITLQAAHLPIIAKLPPLRWLDFVTPLYREGIKAFHLCNTIATPKGGLSGPSLKPYSLWAVEEVRQKYSGDVRIIGGGGIYTAEDASDFLGAGADYVAVASCLINPFYRKRRLREITTRLRHTTFPYFLPLENK